MLHVGITKAMFDIIITRAMRCVNITYSGSIDHTNPKQLLGGKTDIDFAIAIGELLSSLDDNFIALIKMGNANRPEAEVHLDRLASRILELVYKGTSNEKYH